MVTTIVPRRDVKDVFQLVNQIDPTHADRGFVNQQQLAAIEADELHAAVGVIQQGWGPMAGAQSQIVSLLAQPIIRANVRNPL